MRNSWVFLGVGAIMLVVFVWFDLHWMTLLAIVMMAMGVAFLYQEDQEGP